ncbi:MAG: glycosyl transferase [Acidobacteriota bacterium]|nr:glycosyl transferase [Acidobacteriota bacterium]MDQ7088218.1 glycosyl transferase [Acidobacteriota bacterium]
MSDFYQRGLITTLHNLGHDNCARLESELLGHARRRPIALVLPTTVDDFHAPPMEGILARLVEAPFLGEIVFTLGPAGPDDFAAVRRRLSDIGLEATVLWNDGPRLTEIARQIEKAQLPLGLPGKGRSAWMAFGYVIGRGEFHSIALHDCDIVTYERRLLPRLCYGVTHPELGYEFCKGYYSRVTDRLHGRATRLLVTPLLRSLVKMIGHHPLLTFFDSFRYPLAGEFAMTTRLARQNRIPGDWGLEVGVLAEVYRNVSLRNICQADIADGYEHKHQALSPEDAGRGLHKMGVDICKSLFRTLASEGVIFSGAFFNTLVAAYVKTAENMLERYQDDAAINSLIFDRHAEARAVETFTHAVREAAATISDDPLGVPLIASWDRVASAIDGICENLVQAVQDDNR